MPAGPFARRRSRSRELAWSRCAAALLLAACSETSAPERNGLVAIAIGPASLTVLDGGTTAQLTATGTREDGSTVDLTASAAWSTSDSAVASVEPSGLLRAGWAGSVTVTASAEGISGTAPLRVAGLAPLGVTFLDAREGYLDGYLDAPVAVLDGLGSALVAYGINAPSGRSLVTRVAGEEWPAAWVEQDAGIEDASLSSGADVQLAANGAGAIGMLYRRTTDGLNASWYSFGIAYHDGSEWAWAQPWQGSIDRSLLQDGESGTAALAVDPAGTMFVAYQGATETYSLEELRVARFDSTGFVDETSWAEYVTNLHVAASPSGKVMVLNEWTGSRLFDGTAWGPLEPLPERLGPGARLFLEDDGTATIFAPDSSARVLRRGAEGGWSPSEKLSGIAGVRDASFAMDGTGRAIAAWSEPVSALEGDEVIARVFDGTSWGPARVLDTTAPPDGCCGTSLGTTRVLTDGAGRFVVLWYRGYAQRATWFDGEWHAAVPLAPGGVFEPEALMRPDGRIVVISDRDAYNSLYASTYALLP